MADGTVTVDEAVALLNEIHDLDPTVLPALCRYRVPCNEALADHPTVQVGGEVGKAEVGFLGIINGIFGIMPDSGSGYIAGHFNEDGTISHFSNLHLDRGQGRSDAD